MAELKDCPWCGLAPERNAFAAWCSNGHPLIHMSHRAWNRRTPAAQNAAQGREVVDWRYACASAKEYIEAGDTENALSMLSSALSATPATSTTNSGEIGRKSVGEPAGRGFVCTGDAIRCHDGHGCECEMSGRIPTPDSTAGREEDEYVIEQMGRLLAEIAIIVRGPEPSMTKWSYHDLPELVRDKIAGASTPDSTAAAQGREGAEVRLVIIERGGIQAIRRWENLAELPPGEYFLRRLSQQGAA